MGSPGAMPKTCRKPQNNHHHHKTQVWWMLSFLPQHCPPWSYLTYRDTQGSMASVGPIRTLTWSRGESSVSCSDTSCLGLALGKVETEEPGLISLLELISKLFELFFEKSGDLHSPWVLTSRTFTDFPFISVPFISSTAIFASWFFLKARDAYL